MKNLIAIQMLILSIAFSQSYVIVEGDSVEFGMLNLNRNCGAIFVMNVGLADNIFTIAAIDSGDMATCGSCDFDVQVVVGGLESGTYAAQFFSYDINDIVETDSTWEYTRDTTYIGEADFVITAPPVAPFSILSSYQSPCYHGMDLEVENQAAQHALIRNYPNPFNNATNIEFIIPYTDVWDVSIFDLRGQRIFDLARGNYLPGFHELRWEAQGVPSGVYLIRVSSSVSVSSVKMVLLK